ncbi:hypothetical protein BC941DRAFT_461183 [Chlamydoabsidia padenii]|nr:hypothetical protein BC941DRAFT_461183 [Chlamydoabsidia padenii]
METTPTLTIPRAETKVVDNHSYTLYMIVIKTLETKRRYSEFESFRTTLSKLHPALFVPPIPGKHSLSDYAHVHTQSRHKDEQAMVEKRKRMLQRFLCRLIEHPILSKEHVLHQFLQPDINWNDYLSTLPINTIKNPLPESSPGPGDSSTFVSSLLPNLPSQILPIPTTSYTLKSPDPKYVSSEALLNKQSLHASSRFDRSQKKVLRRLGDLANDYGEMGAIYNALSLDEVGVMANAVEQLGLSNDDTCQEMQQLVTQLEIDFAEHVQEYVQHAAIAKQSIRYWYMKQAQLEMIGEALVTKQTALHTLLKTEGQAERLQATMDPTTITNQGDFEEEEDESFDIDTHSIEDGFSAVDTTSSVLVPSHNATIQVILMRKLFNAVSYTLQGMMDVDPELTRRNQIESLKTTIAQLETTKRKTAEESKQIGVIIQEEMQRFEKQKGAELKKMMIAFAKLHLQFCEKNMISWQRTRQQVETMAISD